MGRFGQPCYSRPLEDLMAILDHWTISGKRLYTTATGAAGTWQTTLQRSFGAAQYSDILRGANATPN